MMLLFLWWAAVNGLTAWSEAAFLRRLLADRPRRPLSPYLLSAVFLAVLSTAALLSPAAAHGLQLTALLLYGGFVLRARPGAVLLPAVVIVALTIFRLSLSTALLSCLSLTLDDPGLGLALQVALSFALVGVQFLALHTLEGLFQADRGPSLFLMLPSGLLLGALWYSLRLWAPMEFRLSLSLWGGPEAALLPVLLLLLGAAALWSTAAAAWARLGQLSLCVRQSAQALDQTKDLRSLRHDLRNHMQVLSGLLRLGNADAAQGYLRELYALSPALAPGPTTGNPVLDALLLEKRNVARESGVHLEVDALFPQSLPFRDTDLCILLSNALDNALRAAAQAEIAAPVVALTVRPVRGFLLMDITNDAPTATPFAPGLGLSNLRRSITRYGGSLQIVQGDTSFHLTVLLPLT